MKKYKFSVIIPVYNSKKYLKKCLDSIVNQTYKNLEIIAVNDASTDDSLSILLEYKSQYENFKVIDLERNHRQGGARNIGIKSSTGEYLSFVDSDDWIELDRYEIINQKLQENDYDAIVGTSYIREYANGETKEVLDADLNFLRNISGHKLSNTEIEQLLFKGSGVWQIIYKASVLKENNVFFPEGLSYEDNYFVPLCFAYVNSVSYIEKPFYHYRQNLESTIHKKDNTQLQRLEVEGLLRREFIKRNIYNKYADGFEILAVKRHYLITLGVMYKFFLSDFIILSNKLKLEFYGLYPKFKNNIYYKKELSRAERIKIILMDISPHLVLMMYKIKYKKLN